MGTPETPQSDTNTELGFTTRTDVGGSTQTQGDANPTDSAAVDPVPVAEQAQTKQAPEENSTTDTGATPGETLGDNAPKLETLQHQLCPNCTVGVLYVTRYDPGALHEVGQGTALAKGHESGGAYDVECRNCGYTDSRALNPGKQWGR